MFRKNQSCSWCHFATGQYIIIMHYDYLMITTLQVLVLDMCVKLVPFCYRPVYHHNALRLPHDYHTPSSSLGYVC